MAVLLLSVIKLIKCCRDTSSINKVPSHAASLQQMIFFDVQTLNMIMSVLEKTVTFISIKGPCGHYDKHIVLFTLIILTLGTCQSRKKRQLGAIDTIFLKKMENDLFLTLSKKSKSPQPWLSNFPRRKGGVFFSTVPNYSNSSPHKSVFSNSTSSRVYNEKMYGMFSCPNALTVFLHLI